MNKKLRFIFVFFIATGKAFSEECSEENCVDNPLSRFNYQSIERNEAVNETAFSLDDIEEQIISSVNGQISKLNTDLSLDYRKKTISLQYNMNNSIPEIDSYFSFSYRKRTVSFNYTVELW